MIARLKGIVVEEALDHLVLDVRGVGYLVHAPVGTVARTPVDAGGEVSLTVHTVVREDAILLFGFATSLEKEMFMKMIAVSGIGPKLAIAVLSDLTVEQLVRAVRTDDLVRLTKVSGVGKKTAQRLLLELKSSVEQLGVITAAVEPRPTSRIPSIEDDLRSALLNLGYKPQAIDDAMTKLLPIPEDLSSMEPLLRQALKLLS
ncbi:MAG: Holliday junction branch migration protein RuvA [bacterium]